MHPSASSGTVVQLPPKAPEQLKMDRGGVPSPPQQKVVPVNDLLDGGTQPENKKVSGELTDFFDSVAISAPINGNATRPDANPFNAFTSVHPFVAANTPTIAQLPMHATVKVPTHQVLQHGHPNQYGNIPHVTHQHVGYPVHNYQGNQQGVPNLQSGTSQPHPIQGTQAFAQPPNHSQNVSGLPQTYTQHQQQRPPASNMSQFDPMSKR
jgi:hypothetical protein